MASRHPVLWPSSSRLRVIFLVAVIYSTDALHSPRTSTSRVDALLNEELSRETRFVTVMNRVKEDIGAGPFSSEQEQKLRMVSSGLRSEESSVFQVEGPRELLNPKRLFAPAGPQGLTKMLDKDRLGTSVRSHKTFEQHFRPNELGAGNAEHLSVMAQAAIRDIASSHQGYFWATDKILEDEVYHIGSVLNAESKDIFLSAAKGFALRAMACSCNDGTNLFRAQPYCPKYILDQEDNERSARANKTSESFSPLLKESSSMSQPSPSPSLQRSAQDASIAGFGKVAWLKFLDAVWGVLNTAVDVLVKRQRLEHKSPACDSANYAFVQYWESDRSSWGLVCPEDPFDQIQNLDPKLYDGGSRCRMLKQCGARMFKERHAVKPLYTGATDTELRCPTLAQFCNNLYPSPSKRRKCIYDRANHYNAHFSRLYTQESVSAALGRPTPALGRNMNAAR